MDLFYTIGSADGTAFSTGPAPRDPRSERLRHTMTVRPKTPSELVAMRTAGRLAAQVLDMVEEHVRPGVSTEELDVLCHRYMVEELGVVPAPLHYRGFPKSICTSVNHVVCHGIPGPKVLREGDIINIDITVIKDGWHGDASRMYTAGTPSILARRLIDTTHQALLLGIEAVKPGGHLGDIGEAIQTYAEAQGFSVVREYCGHGIGRGFHEEPQVLHYGRRGEGLALVPGLVFTIEPMINAGRRHVKTLPDGWTVVTRDRSLSAQWEHTVAVTETGCEVLTLGASGVP